MKLGFSLLVTLVAIFLIAGCADPRRDAVREVVGAHIPEGLALDRIDGRFRIQSAPDGTRTADVPVYFVTTQDRFRANRLLTTSRGRELARETDEIAAWATTDLRADDEAREKILALRNAVPSDALVLTPTVEAGREIASVLHLHWAAEAIEPQITAGLPALDGAPMDPGAGVHAGSPEESALLAAFTATVQEMEETRATWISRKESRDQTSRDAWGTALAHGAVFESALRDGTPVRLLVRQAFSDDRADLVLTIGQSPVRTFRFGTRLRPEYAGGYDLDIHAAARMEIPSPDRMAIWQPLRDLVQAQIRLRGELLVVDFPPELRAAEFRPAGVTDVLPGEFE